MRLGYSLVPDSDLVVQALTSRVSKQVVFRWLGELPVGRFEGPVKFSFLFDGGRPLWGDGEEPVVLRGGGRYRFFVVLDLERVGEDLALRFYSPPSRVQLYGGYASLGLEEVLLETVEPLERGRFLSARFVTPALLQYPKPPRLKSPSVNSLYPQPRLVVLNLVQRARAYGVEAPLSLYVYAPFDLVESTHAVRPAAVYVGPHHAVGFVGPVLYRVNAPDRRWRWLSLLFSMARFIGVGRSTSMGFGWVEVSVIK